MTEARWLAVFAVFAVRRIFSGRGLRDEVVFLPHVALHFFPAGPRLFAGAASASLLGTRAVSASPHLQGAGAAWGGSPGGVRLRRCGPAAARSVRKWPDTLAREKEGDAPQAVW